jgi:Transmembrane protein 26
VLPILTLAIWSWSLLQFTVVLTATKSSRRSRISAPVQSSSSGKRKGKRGKRKQRSSLGAYCCSVDVWGIIINILLQDAPFVTFRYSKFILKVNQNFESCLNSFVRQF